jgi:hypothetical protein
MTRTTVLLPMPTPEAIVGPWVPPPPYSPQSTADAYGLNYDSGPIPPPLVLATVDRSDAPSQTSFFASDICVDVHRLASHSAETENHAVSWTSFESLE